MIKVLVVEDSPVVREFLIHILESDPEIRVVGTASNGEEALHAVQGRKPDVITMDIHMPKMDGFEATRRIMETHAAPIIIVSGSSDSQEVAATFRAVEVGALAVLPRPKGIGDPEHEATVSEFVRTVKLMSEVKVVRRWARLKKTPSCLPTQTFGLERPAAKIRVVAIGASTGGPIALQTILSQLKNDFPVPLLVVQHMCPGFVQGFADWLSHATGFSVHVASHGEPILPAHAYVAPDGFHMGVAAPDRIELRRDEPMNGLCPSISYLFRSVATVYGQNAVGVVLTGMGRDGVEELKLMKDRGAVTVAQDEESSVVPGMPGEAIKLDAASYVLSPDRIAAMLMGLVNKR
ncbi:MAG: chemotaxis-specific protein-glutamate methyltransferase CheB [Deltaproteobacteria bacterium]|nr:chemotaxis-specific protein-glutamate methyltransferase CheB [Deltaproteobacteria bacterium]